jgi:hypothetical protein
MFKDIKQAYSMFLFVYYLQGLFPNVQDNDFKNSQFL